MIQKSKMSKFTMAASAAVLAALLWAPASQAIVVGNGAGTPTSSSYDITTLFGPYLYYQVGPVDVSHDYSAGPWEKTFNLRLNGQSGTVVEGGPYSMGYLLEIITVGRGTQLTDWHEKILTPGWEWWNLREAPFAGEYYPGIYLLGDGNSLVPGLTYDMTDTTFDFFFDPLAPGTVIGILKGIQWVGINDRILDERTGGPFVISEYPTVPEPSTFILLGAGLAGLAVWRKKRA